MKKQAKSRLIAATKWHVVKKIACSIVACLLLAANQFLISQVHRGGLTLPTIDDAAALERVGTGAHTKQVLINRRANRISFNLQRNLTLNNTFAAFTRCGLGEKVGSTGNGNRKRWFNRIGLQNEFQVRGLLDFGTTISTDLNILVMGDSVGIQFAQGMEEAAGASVEHRTVFRESWPSHEGNAVSAPVRGGGVVASWRITAMLQRAGEDRPLPNMHGGGWVRDDALRLLNYTYSSTLSTSDRNKTVESMDVLVFRIMHGWIAFQEITEQALQETVELAHELLKVRTVVFVTIPFSNNVKTIQDLHDMHRVNSMIRSFCNTWAPAEHGVRYVRVHEYGNFTHELIERNARAIGINTTVDDDSYMLMRFSQRKFPVSIAQACATMPEDYLGGKVDTCDRNYLTIDGMHPCMETVGARVNACIACLLACVYNHNDPSVDTNPDVDFVRRCAEDCNKRFMALIPLDDAIIAD